MGVVVAGGRSQRVCLPASPPACTSGAAATPAAQPPTPRQPHSLVRSLTHSPERALLMNPAWRASSRASRVKISATTGLLFCRRRPSSLYSRKPENSADGSKGGGESGEKGGKDVCARGSLEASAPAVHPSNHALARHALPRPCPLPPGHPPAVHERSRNSMKMRRMGPWILSAACWKPSLRTKCFWL